MLRELTISLLSSSFSGTVDWRAWTLTSSSVHLVFLVVCFVLAYYNLWPSWHHKKIKNFSPATRDLIREVVNDNWKKLMDSTRDLIDARLEDGENYIVAVV